MKMYRNSKLQSLAQLFRTIDRYLPMVLLVCVLSWQNAVSASHAEWVYAPELLAADGQQLSVADFCNRDGGADLVPGHCGSCASVLAAMSTPPVGVSLGLSFSPLRNVLRTPVGFGLVQCEVSLLLKRGPPSA